MTQITDPFGRSASFTYNSSGLLASITDVLGITSSYTYGQGTDPDFINTLTTPYGSTTFTYGDSSTNATLGNTRFLKTVDPLMRTSYVEYSTTADPGDESNGAINSAFVPIGMTTCNQLQDIRNTFVFDANQYALATASGGLNYSLGKAIHWLRSSDEVWATRVIESEKKPLENRVWYNYPGELGSGSCDGGGDAAEFGVASAGVVTNGASSERSAIGRVLDSGASQVQTYQYNASGRVTQATDAVGRQATYTYASNGIDRLTTSNTTSGSQLLETRTYNSQHLPLTIKGANGMTAHYAYNANGQITRVTDQLGHATAMTYDSSGHLETIQGPISSAKSTFAYDSVGRVGSATDPAGLTVHFTYDAADRRTGATYPDGTHSTWAYTLLDQTSITDRLGHKTTYSYDADRELTVTTDPLHHTVRQGYNLAGTLNSITDANNHTTTFVLDAQSRLTAKHYANGTSMSVAYESSRSRVATVTDALYQTTDYTYNPDDTIATVSYSAHLSTASVSFQYDPAYTRPVSMTDGIGTTTYRYYPVSSSPALGANLLHSVTSPIAGASGSDTVVYSYDALNRVVGTTINGVAQSAGFDALGRITSVSNPLDTFTYGYADGTSRVSAESSNAGPTTALTYFGATGDELLNQKTTTTHSGSTALSQFGYTYDADDNVKSATISAPSAQTTSYTYDAANRLLSGLFSGSTPQYAYSYDSASNLTSITPNGATQNYAYTATNTITAGSYDANGSTTALSGNAYTWDGANRVVSFANTANSTSSTFTYDGLGHLVRVVDSHSGSVTADHSYTWCGSVRCLAHDNTQSGSPVSTQYFGQGIIKSGTPYYYVRDRLGSVAQLVTSSGSVASQFTYDPYGNRTTVSGTVMPDVGYASYFDHAVSGLDFTLHRAYDPIHARWLNRDPIAEAGGVNLYAYVRGNPISLVDPYGLWSWYGAFNGASGGLVQGTVTGALVGALAGPEAAVPGAVLGGLTGTVGGFIAGGLADGGVGGAAAGAVGGGIGGIVGGAPGVIGGATGGAIAGAVGTQSPSVGALIGGISGGVAGAVTGGIEEGPAGAIAGGASGALGGIAGGYVSSVAAAKAAASCPAQ